MNRIIAIITVLLAISGQSQAATYYKIKVAGVEVNSSNASNITSSLIQACDESVNGGKPSVTYTGNASGGTLTLYNAKIVRTGSDNRAILNDGNPGLTIVFKGQNFLYAQDASPVRLNANTYIMCKDGGKATICGRNEDGLCPYNGATVTINKADLFIKAERSSAIEGGNSGSVVIYNSKVESYGYTSSVSNLSSLKVEGDSEVHLTMATSAVTVKNVADFILNAPMALTSPNGVYFDYTKKTFCTSAYPNGQPSTIIMKTTSLEINATNFPDDNFRSYVSSNFDENDNGYLSDSEISIVNNVKVSNMGIKDLKGLEYFTELTNLECDNNQLKALDVTQLKKLQLLGCDGNQLTTLNLSNNTELQALFCGVNALTSLDLSKNTKLQRLYCQNNSLGSLNLTKNTALIYLSCIENLLTSLDLSKNTELISLSCNDNQLTSLDLSNNKKLESLYCYNNKLSSLKLSSECADLRFVYCYNNCLRGASMSELIGALPTVPWGLITAVSEEESSTTGNLITTQQVQTAKSKGWEVRICTLSGNYEDYAGINPGLAIDETNFPDYYFRLYVSLEIDTDEDGYLSDEEIAATKKIMGGMKNIQTLKGVEFFTELTELECYYNHLTELDLSKNKKLTYLDCSYNQLTKLDLSKNTALTEVYIEDNKIAGDDMTAFANKLPTIAYGFLSVYELNSFDEHNTINADQVAIMTEKGWRVYYLDDRSEYTLYGSVLDAKIQLYAYVDIINCILDEYRHEMALRYDDPEAVHYMSQLTELGNRLYTIVATIEASTTIEACNKVMSSIADLQMRLTKITGVIENYINGIPTDISDAERLNDKGQRTNDKPGEVYDLQGRRINGQTVNGQRSIVIVNGKKKLVK